MSNNTEFLRVINTNGEWTGQYMERAEASKKDGVFFNTVFCWLIIKETKQVVFEKRSLNKKYNPGKYGLVGGHVEKDDSIEDTLIKEVAEEIGYDISKLNKINLGVAKPAGLYKSFAYNFLIFIPNKIPNPSLQVTEVECIEYLDYSFVRESVKNNEDKFSITWDRYSDIFNRLDKILKYDSFANNTVDKFAKYFRNDKIFFFPSKENERKEVLNEIIRRWFDKDKEYSELELNNVIKANIETLDHAFFRRSLVDHGLIVRNNDGTKYSIAQ